MAEERLKYLFELQLAGNCTPLQQEELFALALENKNEELLKQLLEQSWTITGTEEDLELQKAQTILTSIVQQQPAVVRKMQVWKKIAIAASIIITIGILYFVIPKNEGSQPTPDSPLATHDVPAPDKNRAQIKLSDGTIVFLDSAANGQLATQSNVVVTKTEDGKIIYAVIPTQEGTVEYNTLMNPRGSKVQPLTLSDGTKVWLNAESSITYPTAFIGNERKVTMKGEAYFEVAHNKAKPFIVSANDKADVTVLGTHFNVNAYENEADIKITLLEGSVKVSNEADSKTIKPGQQAIAVSHSPLSIHHSPDLEQVLAWKNGFFNFNNADIKEILRQAARWYNLDVVYSGTVTNDKYKGKINRDAKLSELLKILELNKVKFTIQGNKLTVE